MITFIDTETTGLPKWDAAPIADGQPRVVQVAALQTDDNGVEINSMSAILKPDGFTIPPFVAAIHGITTQRAINEGLDRVVVLNMVTALLNAGITVVAHNIKFDQFMIAIEVEKHRLKLDKRETRCTMEESTDVCKLPKKRGSGYKWPKLEEAYMHLIGKPLIKAHDALEDVRACKEIFFVLKKRNS